MIRDQTSRAYAGYVLGVLALVNCVNSMDRSIVNILVEPIRLEFGFTDGQIGVISGLGFAIFYTLIGLPIARAADLGNRRNILSAGVAIWSAMTVLTGRAIGFWTMLAARIGVGIGESTCFPTAYSLISDYFPSAQRSRAMAIFQLGLYGGIIAGAVAAGTIAQAHGWRAAFYVVGAPGLVLAVLTRLTVREPKRGKSEVIVTQAASPRSGMAAILALMLADRAFMFLVLSTTLFSVTSAIMGSWGSAFLMRLHAVQPEQVGLLVGPIIASGGITGTLLGGFLGTFLARRNRQARAPILVPLWLELVAVPAILTFVFAKPLWLCVAGGGIGSFILGAHTGPVLAVAISRMRPEVRGLASSIVIGGQLLLGFGLGPTLVGLLSDAFQPSAGVDALRYALLAAPAAVLCGWGCLVIAFRILGPETYSAQA